MSTISSILLILFLMVSANSCSSVTPEKFEPKPKNDLLIGKITSVYPEHNYMLIQKYTNFKTGSDVIFYSRGADGSINSLKMNDLSRGQFYTADLIQGKYTPNDPVFMRYLSDPNDENLNVSPDNLPESDL